MNNPQVHSMIRPTTKTPFHIDFEWWKHHDANWRIYLFGFLCPEHQKAFEGQAEVMIDVVDPQTAEVQRVDGLQYTLMKHCAQQPDFIARETSLVNRIFKLLLANGNRPMTPEEMAPLVGRPAETILRTLSGPQVYQGIRPCKQ